jgi:hypothetical protein
VGILGETQFLERTLFFNGQRLLATDLQDLETFEREMRWLHNMSLHQPGIGSGYAVSGKKGDRQVTISPGYAIDALGREIILTMPVTEQVPPVPDNGAGQPALYDLLVSYPSAADLTPSETRSGVCAAAGVVRLHEQPVFCWARLTDDGKNPVDPRLNDLVHRQLMIVLGRISVQNCQLKDDLMVAIRRNARPAQLPKVASGVATVELANKSDKNLPPPAAGIVAAALPRLSTIVDTSSAGFVSVPSYYARLRSSDPRIVANLSFGSVIHITGETPTSFQFELIWNSLLARKMTRSFLPGSSAFLDIVWMGVEV